MKLLNALGIGQVILIILQLTGVIAWSAWWVLSPLWISAAGMALIIALIMALNV